MTNKKQPIVPVFRGERYHGEIIEGILFPSKKQPYIETKEGYYHAVKPETIKMSLDDEKWYSMERLGEIIRMGEKYERMIERGVR